MTMAIVIEWCRSDDLDIDIDNEDMIIDLIERGLYLDDINRNPITYKLNKKDMKKLKKFILLKKDVIKFNTHHQNCSICYEPIDNIKKKVIKVPKCFHIFHWNCLREWLKISPSCPNCRIYVKLALRDDIGINNESFTQQS